MLVSDMPDRSCAADMELFFSSITSLTVAVMADKCSPYRSTRRDHFNQSAAKRHSVDNTVQHTKPVDILAKRPASTDRVVHQTRKRNTSTSAKRMLNDGN